MVSRRDASLDFSLFTLRHQIVSDVGFFIVDMLLIVSPAFLFMIDYVWF